MNEPASATHDSLLPLLVAFDEGLAAGRPPELAPPPELAAEFEAAQSVLRLLNQAWPQPSSADTTLELAPAAPMSSVVSAADGCGQA